MSEWRLGEDQKSTFIYELGDDEINKWQCDVGPGFSGGERTKREYLHSVALKMRAANELYERLSVMLELVGLAYGNMYDDVAVEIENTKAVLAKARGESQ